MPDEFNITFPVTGGGDFQTTLRTGGILFLLGANGTGKSSLVTRLFRDHAQNAKRISAHRQTWFTSNSLEMTPLTRDGMESNIRSRDTQDQSRHRHEYSNERTAMALFDLIDADTTLARRIADLVRSEEIEEARAVGKEPGPLAVINQLMRASNIPIEIEVQERQKVVARKNGGPTYSVAELSDGERNAFLVAADVLTAKPGTLLVIDEPERHLHRSIISPLLTLLFAARSDCAFIISTHELMLPVDNPGAATILVRSSTYNGSTPTSWVADLLPADAPLEEGLKLDILGGRQKMIFIEGTVQSLDAPLYSLLFPQVSIVPKASCRDVEYAVRGLRAAETNHWVKAWGIVDNDRRPSEEIARLREFGVFALPHFSVEALYYHPEVVRRVAARTGAVTGKDPKQLFDAAVAGALAETEKQRDHFVLDAVQRLTRRRIFASLPTKADIKAGGVVKVEVDVDALTKAEEADFDGFVKSGDLSAILERYPLRESSALGVIASAVGLKGRADYENAVRVLLQTDDDALKFLRGLFGELVTEVSPPVAAAAEPSAVVAN